MNEQANEPNLDRFTEAIRQLLLEVQRAWFFTQMWMESEHPKDKQTGRTFAHAALAVWRATYWVGIPAPLTDHRQPRISQEMVTAVEKVISLLAEELNLPNLMQDYAWMDPREIGGIAALVYLGPELIPPIPGLDKQEFFRPRPEDDEPATEKDTAQAPDDQAETARLANLPAWPPGDQSWRELDWLRRLWTNPHGSTQRG